METAETHFPHLLSISFIATPMIFFFVVASMGPVTNFAVFLFIAWTIAALATAFCFAVDRKFRDQFTDSERLAIVVGNAMVALFVGVVGFLSFGFS